LKVVEWRSNRVMKILVAEETDYLQELMRVILSDLGHDVTLVDNGQMAVEAVEEQDFELVLMDIRMPIMDGLEATAAIRSLKDEKSNIPIIALTADVTTSNMREYREKGLDQTCGKPIDVDVLLKQINLVADEEIHTRVDHGLPIVEIQTITDDNNIDINKAGAKGDSFHNVMKSASKVIDQVSKSDRVDIMGSKKMKGLSKDKLAMLLTGYEESLDTNCLDLDVMIQNLKKNPNDESLKDKVAMLAHSLKGGGGTYGYDLITIIAENIDKILTYNENVTPEHIELLSNHAQALQMVSTMKMYGNGGKSGQILLQGLGNIR